MPEIWDISENSSVTAVSLRYTTENGNAAAKVNYIRILVFYSIFYFAFVDGHEVFSKAGTIKILKGLKGCLNA